MYSPYQAVASVPIEDVVQTPRDNAIQTPREVQVHTPEPEWLCQAYLRDVTRDVQVHSPDLAPEIRESLLESRCGELPFMGFILTRVRKPQSPADQERKQFACRRIC